MRSRVLLYVLTQHSSDDSPAAGGLLAHQWQQRLGQEHMPNHFGGHCLLHQGGRDVGHVSWRSHAA